jgi:hypothetical protein
MREVERTEHPSTKADMTASFFAMLITFAMAQVYDSAFAYAREKRGTVLCYLPFLVFAHRALAAFLALLRRCSSVIVSSLRLPPILPPLAPI